MSGPRDVSLIQQAKAVTTNDTLNFNAMFGGTAGAYGGTPSNAVWVGATGNINVRLDNGKLDGAEDIIFHGLIAGTWHTMPPFVHVYAGSTTATNIRVGVTAR